MTGQIGPSGTPDGRSGSALLRSQGLRVDYWLKPEVIMQILRLLHRGQNVATVALNGHTGWVTFAASVTFLTDQIRRYWNQQSVRSGLETFLWEMGCLIML